MKFKNVKFVGTDIPNGIQAILEFGRDHELSIVKSDCCIQARQSSRDAGYY